MVEGRGKGGKRSGGSASDKCCKNRVGITEWLFSNDRWLVYVSWSVIADLQLFFGSDTIKTHSPCY